MSDTGWQNRDAAVSDCHNLSDCSFSSAPSIQDDVVAVERGR